MYVPQEWAHSYILLYILYMCCGLLGYVTTLTEREWSVSEMKQLYKSPTNMVVCKVSFHSAVQVVL